MVIRYAERAIVELHDELNTKPTTSRHGPRLRHPSDPSRNRLNQQLWLPLQQQGANVQVLRVQRRWLMGDWFKRPASPARRRIRDIPSQISSADAVFELGAGSDQLLRESDRPDRL